MRVLKLELDGTRIEGADVESIRYRDQFGGLSTIERPCFLRFSKDAIFILVRATFRDDDDRLNLVVCPTQNTGNVTDQFIKDVVLPRMPKFTCWWRVPQPKEIWFAESLPTSE